MEQTLSAFRRAIRGPQTPKQEVRNSWGVYDYYKYYRKTKPKGHEYVLSESQYFAIIRKVNQKLTSDILNGETVTLPYNMGQIEAFKKSFTTRLWKGRVITNRPIDWDRTMQLWYEDKEAYKRKDIIYYDSDERVLITYNTTKATYVNKIFYQFRPVKETRKGLKQLRRTNGFTNIPYFISKKDEANIKGLYNG